LISFYKLSTFSKIFAESGAMDMEIKILLRELARVYEKDFDDDYDIDGKD